MKPRTDRRLADGASDASSSGRMRPDSTPKPATRSGAVNPTLALMIPP